ncbi:MAG: dipeptidase [Oscillospiraceae bacterium]|nr:dipeptidase [Oscillospiraceae bacterium]
MNDMRIIDMHCDTLLVLRMTGRNLDEIDAHINVEKLRRGGAMLQCFAIFTPTGPEARIYRLSESPWEYFLNTAQLFENQLQRCSAELAPMRSMAELRRNMAEGKISAMLTLEDAVCIDGDISRVQTLYDKGVRMVTLTWNYENSLAYPNSPDPELHAKGLKDFGIEAVSEMNRLGMIVDVSHLSEGGFYDVAHHSTKPFVASHSCARAVCEHSRSLTDKQLRTLADCGGVCGVNFYSAFLSPESEYSRNEEILLHMEHIVNKAGVESVALGSDFDGISCGLEMKDYAGMARLSELIAERFGADNADRILHGNALRVFGDVLN